MTSCKCAEKKCAKCTGKKCAEPQTIEAMRAGAVEMGRWEVYMHGRLMATKRHTTEEAYIIIERVKAIRKVFCEAPRQWDVVSMNLSFYGFGNEFERNIMLRCLKIATCPRVVHSTFMPTSPGVNFEGFILVHPNSAVAAIEDLESFLDLFKMSVGVTDLGSYMQAPMLTCIERVESGVRPYGNWKAMRSSSVRNCFTALKRERDLRIAKENVRRLTGLEFTTTNMTALHHARRNAEIDESQRLHMLRHLAVHLNTLGIMILDETEISEQIQYLRNVQGIVNDAINDPSRLQVVGLDQRLERMGARLDDVVSFVPSSNLLPSDDSNIISLAGQIVLPRGQMAGPNQMMVIDLTM